ncbi:MAG: hypothetical protein LWW98_07480 [Deltaproteobacteria bacterium]|nr:hypothetical protein [Deltaproteobacteria bacterium]
MWFFALTEEADTLMREKGMFWSMRERLDGLLKHVGLRQLSELANEDRDNRTEM